MLLVAILIFVWLWMKAKYELSSSNTFTTQLQETLAKEQESSLKIGKMLQEREQEYYGLEKELAVLQTKFEDDKRAFEEKIQLLDETKSQMKTEFAHLASQIFEQKTKTFDETHKQGIDTLLKPFREQIEAFSKQSRDMFVHDAKERQSIKDELVNLKTLNERLSQDALNLTQALKGENKTQGNWGEIVLERVLEESGLREGHEYVVQNTLKGEDDKIYRPDVIVKLPQDKHIVIDSKVSLVAYDNFIKAENEIDRNSSLKAHIASINAHVKNLSQKKYEELGGLKSLDFVLLFMPIEGAFLLALESDNGFFKNAYEQNIIIVSPSTLLVTLRTIEHIWRREYQEQNAISIAKSAEALYDKFALFVEDMERIGKNIQTTQTSYESAMNKLSSGKGNLINRVEGMRKLGLKPKKLLSLSSKEDEDEL
ncbi:putative DNA recombination protein RmuC [Sulfurovum sp. enrichment culture clone C5]|uniref:Putative DNA recombination protein RmuC n=1 Tax=Sulfurovum sp. enrichment culture clone C5 TaxID=497650 RepID=A0A0S4XNP6_9BACT|nr:putative DNA recombination protein RmuC [Sulfurovum sp. enrichment culture clone C5]